jgi:hypothetical protein
VIHRVNIPHSGSVLLGRAGARPRLWASRWVAMRTVVTVVRILMIVRMLLAALAIS